MVNLIKDQLVNYVDIFQSINSSTNRTILLGNGFSMSLHNGFNYKKLFEVARDKLENDKKLSSELVTIFTKELKTFDFETVLKNLSIATRILQHYGNNAANQKVYQDLEKIRAVFINSLTHVHPDNQNNLENDTKLRLDLFCRNSIKYSQQITISYYIGVLWLKKQIALICLIMMVLVFLV